MTAESLLETNTGPDGFSEAPFYISARVQQARARRTLKHDDSFIVLDSHGDLGASAGGQDGLFYKDTRFLSYLEIVIDGVQPMLLGSNVRDDNSLLTVELTNPDIFADGDLALQKDTVHITRNVFVWQNTAYQRITFKNCGETTISLSATAGSQAGEISDLFDKWFTNLAGNLILPLFDTGRRKAEVERNRAIVRERFYQWEAVLLNALAEVEDALAREEGLQKSYSSIIKQVELAQQTLDRSRALYINGLTDYLTVLTSLQALQNLQRVEINIRKSLISNRIKLHSALGGSWTSELIEPQSSIITTG